jgi:uncharacterized phage protein gp47/JayE
MAFVRPTLQQIIERVEGDFKGALQIVTILRRSFVKALARAISGTAHVVHGHLVFISKQIFPDQAEVEYLDRWGSIYGLERNAAVYTQLEVEFTVTAALTIVAGTIMQRSDQVEYEIDEDVIASGAGTITGTVSARVAGAAGNITDGSMISFQSPQPNVAGEALVVSTLVEGEDRETDEAYRQRVVDRIQTPPSGGTVSDYKAWALEVSGVTRVWVFPGHLGEGTVGVSFVEDNDTPSIIPDAPEIAAVQANIDLKKPVTADVTVFAPIDNPVDLDISLKPNTLVVRDAVTEELRDLFRREANVKGAIDGDSFFTGLIPLSRIAEAISIADGEQDHIITNLVTAPVPATTGGILTLGTITFATLV